MICFFTLSSHSRQDGACKALTRLHAGSQGWSPGLPQWLLSHPGTYTHGPGLHPRGSPSAFGWQLSPVSAVPLPFRVIIACYRPALLRPVPETVLDIGLPCTEVSVWFLAPTRWTCTDINLSLSVFLNSETFRSSFALVCCLFNVLPDLSSNT